MDEERWLAAELVEDLLSHLGPSASKRKLRLFACACCRQIWGLVTEPASRAAVEASEAYAAGGQGDAASSGPGQPSAVGMG